jgi:hypothetical protein
MSGDATSNILLVTTISQGEAAGRSTILKLTINGRALPSNKVWPSLSVRLQTL